MSNQLIEELRKQAVIIIKNEAERRRVEPKRPGIIAATPVRAAHLKTLPPAPKTDAMQWAKLAAKMIDHKEWTDLINDDALHQASGQALNPITYMETLFEGLELKDGATVWK